MFKWTIISVGIIFGIALCISVYANAMPEFFGLVTRLYQYAWTNLPPVAKVVWTFGWGFGLEFISAIQDWTIKIASKLVTGV